MARAECGACGRVFGGMKGFDAHQTRMGDTFAGGELICRDPATLETREGRPRFRLNDAGVWVKAESTLHTLTVASLRASEGLGGT